MNKIISLSIFLTVCILATVVSTCKAQGKDTASIKLSKLEKAKLDAYYRTVREFQKIQEEHFKFLGELIPVNGIDPSRVSLHPDSLKVVDDKLILKLRNHRPKRP